MASFDCDGGSSDSHEDIMADDEQGNINKQHDNGGKCMSQKRRVVI